jgi:predicted transcriptional regulator
MKRGKFEIIIDILNAVTTPSIKTHIMYKTNLNMNMAQPFLEELIQKELIVKIIIKGKSKLHYILTDKGRETLKLANSFVAQLGGDAPHSLLMPSPFSSTRNMEATETCPRQ